MPEGSWKCEKCNNINYPFRTKCNRQNCGADKPSEPKKSPPEAADTKDQVCSTMCLLCMALFLRQFVSSAPHICKKPNSIYSQSFNLRNYFSFTILSFDSWSACLSVFYLFLFASLNVLMRVVYCSSEY